MAARTDFGDNTFTAYSFMKPTRRVVSCAAPMGTPAYGRTALDDARLSLGRQSNLGTEFPSRTQQAARPFGHVGHHRRRFAGGSKIVSFSIRCSRTLMASLRRSLSIACPKIRGVCCNSTFSARRNPSKRPGAYRSRHRAAHPRNWLAYSWHRENGRRSRQLGGGSLGPLSRCAEFVHFRRQHLADFERNESRPRRLLPWRCGAPNISCKSGEIKRWRIENSRVNTLIRQCI